MLERRLAAQDRDASPALDLAGIVQHVPPAVVGRGDEFRDVGVLRPHLLQRDHVGA